MDIQLILEFKISSSTFGGARLYGLAPNECIGKMAQLWNSFSQIWNENLRFWNDNYLLNHFVYNMVFFVFKCHLYFKVPGHYINFKIQYSTARTAVGGRYAVHFINNLSRKKRNPDSHDDHWRCKIWKAFPSILSCVGKKYALCNFVHL